MDDSYILPPPGTPPRRPPERSQQLVGAQFATPQKRRPPQKNSAIVNRPSVALRQQKLAQDLHAMLQPQGSSKHVESHDLESYEDNDVEMPDADDTLAIHDDGAEDAHLPDDNLQSGDAHKQRRVLPDSVTEKLYGTWLALIPTLVPNYLDYLQISQARTGELAPSQELACISQRCTKKEHAILCLHSHCERALI